MESQDEKQSAVHSALNVLADSALITVMSQCMLLLKQPQISNRQKQILKRELSDELVSCQILSISPLDLWSNVVE